LRRAGGVGHDWLHQGRACVPRPPVRYRYLRYRSTVLVSGAGVGHLADPWLVRVVPGGRWRPNVDVYETPHALLVIVELAGVDPDALDVQLFTDALAIEGVRRLPPPEEDAVYREATIAQGPFRVDVPLPAPVDAESVTAEEAHGILTIRLPKRQER